MTAREQKLVYVLAGIGVLGVLGLAYFAVLQPIREANADVERLESELGDKELSLARALKDKKKAEEAKKRSLPADPNVARAEYDAALRRLLAKAGAPLGTTVAPKETTDAKAGPYLNDKKKPAFTRLGFEIVMKKADLPTVMRFLKAYHELGLLHQITRIHITRKDESGSKKDRADLDVKMMAEAVILDGAENRKSLLPVPMGFALVGGNAGYQALVHSAEAGRGIAPPRGNPVLAPGNREYVNVMAKDYFHGLLPKPEAPPVVVVRDKEPEKPAPPKEDISPFIKLTDTTRNPDGSYTSSIYDQLNQQEYKVELTPKGERFEVKVKKLYTLGGKKRMLDSWAELVIAEDNTATDRKFKVIGPSGLDLVLVEKVVAAEKVEKAPEKPDPKARFAPKDSKPKLGQPTDVSALAGGLALVPAAAPPVEKVFVWKLGQNLKNLTEVPADKAVELLKAAAGAAMPRVATTAGNS